MTEIRTFYSLKEIREAIDAQISQYKMLLEDYSQWLGSLLRNPESAKNQEKAKKLAELQKVLKAGGRKGGKKEERNAGFSSEWAHFKDLMVCADDVGEAEILFEATEELKSKIERLEKAKSSIIDLERYGLGKDLLFITYVHDGVPEKVVFKPKKGVGAVEKFEFEANFSVAEQTS
ncbi:MAG: hypothetical protein QW386_05670 [Candidatus Bathyarchaeia archaeon]